MEENLSLNKKDGIAWGVSSMVTGIISILLFLMPYFGLPLAIFAIVANSKQKKIRESGMGTAGFVLGILGIIINSIMGFLVLIGLLLIGAGM